MVTEDEKHTPSYANLNPVFNSSAASELILL